MKYKFEERESEPFYIDLILSTAIKKYDKHFYVACRVPLTAPKKVKDLYIRKMRRTLWQRILELREQTV